MLQKHPKLNEALKKFAIEYCDNPFKYLYEADLQVLLSKHLESVFSASHDIVREQNWYKSLEKKPSMNIGKVHREYPAGILFDNVVLGTSQQLNEDQLARKLIFESWYSQPIKYAIELKLVPLYLRPKTKGADDSMGDYRRFVEGPKSKLKALENYHATPLEYGLQLTLLQSQEDQEEFLKNHNPAKRNKKWLSWFNDEFIPLIERNRNVGYYFVDLASKSLKPVYPTALTVN